MSEMREPVMIMVAPNGARRGKSDHQALPITADEIGADAAACCEAGAGAIHLHVRDSEGGHVLDANRYRDASAAVRLATGNAMAVQITTEAVGIYGPDAQMAVVRDVVPEAASVAVRELVPDAQAETSAAAFFAWMRATGVSPQFILYDASDVVRFFDLRDRGIIPFAQPFLLFVLGRYAADQQSNPEDLDPFIEALGGRTAHWALCAFGRRECDCAAAAMARGGHVRVGFENNLHRADGSVAASNADLVLDVVARAHALGRATMSGEQSREILKAARA